MSTRDEILSKLRTSLNRKDLRFPPQHPQPLSADERIQVTTARGDLPALAERFGRELETLHGTYEVVGTTTEARLALLMRLNNWMEEAETARKGVQFDSGQERCVLTWRPESMPVPGLERALADMSMELVSPSQLHTAEERDKVRFIRFGLTGVEAALAGTGSMIMLSGASTNRAASLLPFHHLALIPFSRIYPNIENWLAICREQGRLVDILRNNANLTTISGPSKSADIEMNLTLGVHGPKFVHAILFDDG